MNCLRVYRDSKGVNYCKFYFLLLPRKDKMPLSLNILCYLFVSEIFFPLKNCDDKFWLSLRWLYQNQPHASVPIFAEMETLLRHYEILIYNLF